MAPAVDLPRLFITKEFADCVIIASNGDEFAAHRVIIAQYDALKARLAQVEGNDCRIQLHESSEVVHYVLQWMYGISWPAATHYSVESTVQHLVLALGVVDAAKKYDIPNLADDICNVTGHTIEQISCVGESLRILRAISTPSDPVLGALQRTIIDRALEILPAGDSRSVVKPESTLRSIMDEQNSHRSGKRRSSSSSTIPKRSGRAKTMTAKAKAMSTLNRHVTLSRAEEEQRRQPHLHCVCRSPEDLYLVQCEGCEKWYHPGCIGKGKYAESTYRHHKQFARKGDEKYYRETGLAFACMDCEDTESWTA